MKKYQIFFLILLICPLCLFGQATERKLTNPNASKEAKALFAYLKDMYGKKILSGQMTSNWGFDELDYIKRLTGKYPAICGFDFIDDKKNNQEIELAKKWWKEGGIVTFMWHFGAPGNGEGYESSKTTIDINKIFQDGTKENKFFWQELKAKADLLEKLKKDKIPVLWRPFHELDGTWFWYSKQGPELFKKLWITMYNYYVNERKLDNLIWVACFTKTADNQWYPGDQYVDIAGADTYDVGNSPEVEMYQKMKKIVGDRKIIPYHECGVPPNPDECLSNGSMWSWWMEWHSDFLKKVDIDYLKKVYNHDLIITRDEVPNILKTYK